MEVESWGPAVSPHRSDGIHHYEGEVQATIDFGFDGIKLDVRSVCYKWSNSETELWRVSKPFKVCRAVQSHGQAYFDRELPLGQ